MNLSKSYLRLDPSSPATPRFSRQMIEHALDVFRSHLSEDIREQPARLGLEKTKGDTTKKFFSLEQFFEELEPCDTYHLYYFVGELYLGILVRPNLSRVNVELTSRKDVLDVIRAIEAGLDLEQWQRSLDWDQTKSATGDQEFSLPEKLKYQIIPVWKRAIGDPSKAAQRVRPLTNNEALAESLGYEVKEEPIARQLWRYFHETASEELGRPHLGPEGEDPLRSVRVVLYQSTAGRGPQTHRLVLHLHR